MKKILSVFLCLILALGIVGCKDENLTSSESSQSKETQKYKNYMTLLYSASDSFNPYEVKTDTNRQLCMLLYDSLVKLDNEFKPVYSIAKSVKIKKNVCTVKLKKVKFSDGTALTAEDVVHSYNLAKEAEGEYASNLYEVTSAKVQSSDTVVFNLDVGDPYFENLLDFPIIKKGSEDVADSDSVKLPPIGCGRYKVSDDKQSLEFNKYYHGKKSDIKEIRLINAPDSESVSHYIEIGAADMYYSNISDGNILRMSGQKIDINLNNLVYIGVNQNYGALIYRELRQAISSGIDRSKICKDTYYNNALPATGFFNPVWQETKSVQNIQTVANSQITIENLQEIGYNNLDSDGFYRKNGGPLSFSLLVNKENRMRVAAANEIAKQLASVGIKITVLEESHENYLQRLKSGGFQLYIGEVKLTDNMDLRSLVTKGGAVAFGVKDTEVTESEEEPEDTEETEDKNQQTVDTSCNQVIEKFYKGEASINDVASVLQTDMPVIPVCYRTGVLFCNDNIENVIGSSQSDIYFSIESYKFKEN